MNLTPEEIIQIIADHSLTIRCLPHVVITHCTYREGDEKRVWVDSNGKESQVIRTVVVNERGIRLLREERIVDKGGWWYVKETKCTDSTIIFNRKHDKFFAPTLSEAIQLYLDSKKPSK